VIGAPPEFVQACADTLVHLRKQGKDWARVYMRGHSECSAPQLAHYSGFVDHPSFLRGCQDGVEVLQFETGIARHNSISSAIFEPACRRTYATMILTSCAAAVREPWIRLTMRGSGQSSRRRSSSCGQRIARRRYKAFLRNSKPGAYDMYGTAAPIHSRRVAASSRAAMITVKRAAAPHDSDEGTHYTSAVVGTAHRHPARRPLTRVSERRDVGNRQSALAVWRGG
jgi:hypothetical protein